MSEFCFDRLHRICGYPPNILLMEDCFTWVNTNDPNGSCADSWGRAQKIKDPHTKLRKCHDCKEWKTPKKCHDTAWIPKKELGKKKGNRYISLKHGFMCVSCMNKRKPLEKQHIQAQENAFLLRKLYRTLLENRK